ncbi:YitT family protein [Levilactobacillus brevis]|nr:YitT family protein [Levilactobacillus brevis]
MTELERGVSLVNGEGGFSHQERKMIYVVVAPSELYRLRQIIQRNDSRAFISVINVNEALGEGFSFGLPDKGWLNRFRH